MGQSQVLERTFGPALVGVNCVYIGCAQTVEINLSEQTRDLSCDRRLGTDGIFHFDPNLQINIQASDFTMDNLAIAMDAEGTTTWAGTETNTLEIFSVTWSGSSGDWSGSVTLNEEISGTVAVFSDSAGAVEWTQSESGTATVTSPCLGTVAMTSSGTAEPTATLYATYAWGDQIRSGSTRVAPPFGSSSTDRYVVIAHKKAQENKVVVWRIWRTQVMRETTITFDNESDDDIPIPIRLRALVDTIGHSPAPMYDINEVDLSGWDPDYQPYTNVVDTYPVV